MELRQLRTFKAVAELGSLSKAADTLRIAQPALSRQIKLLEHELRAKLFSRTGRGMVLTDAGRVLLERTSGIVRQLEQIRDDIQSQEARPSGSVALGIIPTVSAVLAGRLAQKILTQMPNVALRIVEGYGRHLLDWLHRGEIDVALTYGPAVDLHLGVEMLARDELVLVGPPDSPLMGREEVQFSQLEGQRLVLPSRTNGLRMLVEQAAARKKIALDVILEADSFRVLLDVVANGIGYTVLPPSAVAGERERGRLCTARLANPRLSRELVLAFTSKRPASLATHAVCGIVRAEMEAIAQFTP